MIPQCTCRSVPRSSLSWRVITPFSGWMTCLKQLPRPWAPLFLLAWRHTLRGSELSMGLWERTGGGRLFTEHMRRWKLASSICRKPPGWGEGCVGPKLPPTPGFPSHVKPPVLPWLSPLENRQPHGLCFLNITCPKGGTTASCRVSSWSVTILPAHAVVGSFWE